MTIVNKKKKFQVIYEGSLQDAVATIFFQLIYHRLKDDKPCVIGIVADSGEGKSNVAIHIVDVLYKQLGIDLMDFIEDTMIMGIEDYGQKVKAMLHDERLKKCCALIIDEAKATVDSKDWNDMLNRTVSMVNHLSRAIKPLAMFILSQRFRDIDASIRSSLTYYIKVSRPLNEHAWIKVYQFWEDDRDLSNPKPRKSIVEGDLVVEGKYKRIKLSKIVFPKVRKELWEKYKASMVKAKGDVLQEKFDDMRVALEKKYAGKDKTRLVSLFNMLVEKDFLRQEYGVYKYKKWKLNDEFMNDFNVDKYQKKDLESKLSAYFKGGILDGVE